jgi:membrane associated rhomboid family serine protease
VATAIIATEGIAIYAKLGSTVALALFGATYGYALLKATHAPETMCLYERGLAEPGRSSGMTPYEFLTEVEIREVLTGKALVLSDGFFATHIPASRFESEDDCEAAAVQLRARVRDAGGVLEPAKGDLWRRRIPVVTFLLAAIICAVYFVHPPATVALERTLQMLQLGANGREFLVAGDALRIISSTFLHSSANHITNNTLVLLLFGSLLECLWGRVALLFAFLFATYFADIALFVSPTFAAVGASGLTSGVMGFLAASVWLLADRFPVVPLRGLVRALGPLLLLLLLVLDDIPHQEGVFTEGHLAGTASGVLACVVWRLTAKLKIRNHVIAAASLVTLALLPAAMLGSQQSGEKCFLRMVERWSETANASEQIRSAETMLAMGTVASMEVRRYAQELLATAQERGAPLQCVGGLVNQSLPDE